ncbi:uncharacterized protein LOC143288439 [Babylonia areolata]|uniref:uncharacterized protein LOC143288439 n=1 Tax=Babylonia areolata TaxID=304850 RepID=UPI003FD540DB
MKPVKLAVLTIADRPLRFCMMDGSNRFNTYNDMHMTGCQPLFLGSDILHGTSEWDKNLCRIHARFAKQGLATKLVFKDCRIDGLRKGDEAYFYSVHGLFRAVFEYQALPVQRQCLQRLTDVWLKASAVTLPQLESRYKVSLQNLVLVEDQPPPPPPPPPPPYEGEENETETLVPSTQSTNKTEDAAKFPYKTYGPDSPKLYGPDATSSNVSAASALHRISSDRRDTETSCQTAACGQDFGTQTDISVSVANEPQKIVILETVCTMCGTTRQMAERKQADIESVLQGAKRSKTQQLGKGEGNACQVNVSEDSLGTGERIITVFIEEEGEDTGVQSTEVCTPELSYAPDSVTVLNESLPSDIPGKNIHSEVGQTTHPFKCDEHQADEPHISRHFVSSTHSHCGLGHSHRYTGPCASSTSQQCRVIGERVIQMEATSHVSGLHQVQKCVCHVQTQTDDIVQNRDDSFSESDLTLLSAGVNNSVPSNRFHSLIDPDTLHLQAEITGVENTVANNSCSLIDPDTLDLQAETEMAIDAEEPTDNVVAGEAQSGQTEEGVGQQTGCKDAAERVQKCLEEVRKLKLLLESQDADTSSHRSGHTLTDAMDASTTAVTTTQLEMMRVILDFLVCGMVHFTDPSDVSVISEILTLALQAAKNSTQCAPASQECQVAGRLKLCLLSAFGAWLGEEFYRFRTVISQKATAFKQRHITNISDLPPPADVIAELFPSCMVRLTAAWIGLGDLRAAEAVERDHCYQGGGAGWSGCRDPYPLVQLVLELLNNCLVSGMAHVVYCRL